MWPLACWHSDPGLAQASCVTSFSMLVRCGLRDIRGLANTQLI